MTAQIAALVRRIELTQPLPQGRCTLCLIPTGEIAPYYARLVIEDDLLSVPQLQGGTKRGLVLHLPFCQSCIQAFLASATEEMAEAERLARPKKLRKTA